MKERARRGWIGGAFTAVTLGWLLLVLLAPVALARDIGGRAVTLVSAGAYLLGGVVCHQRPDRSFHLEGVQMPVCARCTGLYLGGGLGVLAAAGRRRRGGGPAERLARRPGGTGSGGAAFPPVAGAGEGRRPAGRWAPPWLRWAVLAAAAPTAITFVAEMAGWMPSVGELRAAAGVPLGVAVTWVASLVIRGELG